MHWSDLTIPFLTWGCLLSFRLWNGFVRFGCLGSECSAWPRGGHTRRQGPAVLKCNQLLRPSSGPCPSSLSVGRVKVDSIPILSWHPTFHIHSLFAPWKGGCNNLGWQDNVGQGQQPISCWVNYHLVNNGSSPCAFWATAGTLPRPFPLSGGKWGGFICVSQQTIVSVYNSQKMELLQQ